MKTTKLKRFAALALSIVMAAGTLASCGSSDDGNEGSAGGDSDKILKSISDIDVESLKGKTIRMYTDWKSRGFFESDIYTDFGVAMDSVGNGNAAMMLFGAWVVPQIRGRVPDGGDLNSMHNEEVLSEAALLEDVKYVGNLFDVIDVTKDPDWAAYDAQVEKQNNTYKEAREFLGYSWE